VVIVSFKHKGLEALFRDGSRRGVNPSHAGKLLRILDLLDVASDSKALDVPGWDAHELKGKLAGYWSVKITGNWRVTFRFLGTDVELVDYLDYH